MPLQELQIYALWAGKQTAKGTPNTAPTKRFKQRAGAFNAPREDGGARYSDLSLYPGQDDWVNTLVGNGNPQISATPEELAWLVWAFNGGETTSAVAGPPAKTKHTGVPLPGLGHWLTFFTRQGSALLDRKQFNDCQIGQIEIGGSTGDKGVRITPTVLSLDPAEWKTADPAAALPVKPTLLYTDGTGRFTIDGTVFRGHQEFTVVVNKDLQPSYSDDVVVYDLGIGDAVATIAVTLHFDTDGRAQLNKVLYGSATPSAGTKPARYITGYGSYAFDLRARDTSGVANGDKFLFNGTTVKWNVPDAPDPNPAGGVSTMTLNGTIRKSGAGTPDWQIDIDCDAAAFTV